MHISGDPERQYPVLPLPGTNGKTSTARILTRILDVKGLSTGTYTSPHLQRINERIAANGRPIDDDELADQLSAIADLESMIDGRLTWFDILTGVGYRGLADVPGHAAVVEGGLG